MSMQYLRIHTHFSITGGPASPAEWCRLASDHGYKTLGFADRAPVAALPEFAREAARAGIAPIFGIEIDLDLPSGMQPAVLYACDRAGLENLYTLSSLAYSGWPLVSRPISLVDITAHSAGLILVVPGDGIRPLEWVVDLRPHFPGRLFAGLQPDDGVHAKAAQAADLPLVALPSARYLQAGDARACAALFEARVASGWARPDAYSAAKEGDFLRPPAEVEALFAPWPEAIANAERIVEMCAPAAGALSYAALLPRDLLDGLKARVEAALPSALDANDLAEDARARLSAEWAYIERSGTAEAWAALSRIAENAHAARIPLGAPLGSADDSLVALGLGINALNPLPHAQPSWFDTKQARPVAPGVEVPGFRRGELLLSLAAGAAVHGACYLPMTPVLALRAACAVLNAAPDDTADLLETARKEGWAALQEASGVSEAARLALSIKSAPVMCKPDLDVVAFFSGDGEHTLSLLYSEARALPTWIPWTHEALFDLGYSVLRLEAAPALSVLDKALNYAEDHPVPGFDASAADTSVFPVLSEGAAALLKKGEMAGIPYLSPKALKGWKGEFTPESVASLIAASGGHSPGKAPDGVTAWVDNTADTGGSLLYYDQFAAIVQAAAGISPQGAAALRLAMLRPDTDPQGALRARVIAGCLQNGLDAEPAARLYSALSGAAPHLISRYAAHAHARIVLWSTQLKAAHLAAFAAAALEVAWERGGRASAQPITDNARHHGVAFLAPDIRRSGAGPALTRGEGEEGWSILWGLAQLPNWDRATACRFVTARDEIDCQSLSGLSAAIARANLTPEQAGALVRSGACDSLGRREALLNSLPALMQIGSDGQDGQAVSGPEAGATPSPRERYLLRVWEEQNLGVGFTAAPEMEQLAHVLGQNPDLQAKLTTAAGISRAHIDQSICMVGLLHDIRLVSRPSGSNGHNPTDETHLAVAWVEDLEGTIELVAFPPNYKRHKDLWVDNSLVIITARVCAHKDGEGVYLLCEHLVQYQGQVEEEIMTVRVRAPKRSDTVMDPGASASESKPLVPAAGKPESDAQPVSAAEKARAATATTTEPPTYHLIITLPVSHDDHADIDRMLALDKLLKARPGPDTVTLRIPYSPETGAVTSAQLPRGVRYTPGLEADIRGLLGPDALALIKLLG